MHTSKKRKPETPHLYLQWYPKSKRFYWHVNPMPKPYTFSRSELYRKAHDFKCKLNNHIGFLQHANIKEKA